VIGVSRRHLLAATLLAVLAGCEQAGEYGKREFIRQADEALAEAKAAYQMTGAGLVIPDKTDAGLLFGSAQASVLPALQTLRGKGAAMGRNEECPPGPLDFADYVAEDGSTETLYFQDGKFVGWMVRVNSETFLALDRQAMAQEGDFHLVDSTLGTQFEFDWNGPVQGLLEDDSPGAKVTALWAGTVCNFT
jgi:hypothetical protein